MSTPILHIQPVIEPKRTSRMVTAAILPVIAVVVLWCIYFVDGSFSLNLSQYALLPRHVKGLRGILIAPLIHDHSDHLQHLWNNSVAVLMLGWSLLYFYPRKAGNVIAFVWLFGGACVWMMGRENYHLGASGVIYGIASFLFVSGVLRRQRTLMALSLLMVFLYGSMIWGVLPLVPSVSWESHLWGLISGVIMAHWYRDVLPAVQDPVPITFSEDDEDDLEELAEASVPEKELQEVHPIHVSYTIVPSTPRVMQDSGPPPSSTMPTDPNTSNS